MPPLSRKRLDLAPFATTPQKKQRGKERHPRLRVGPVNMKLSLQFSHSRRGIVAKAQLAAIAENPMAI